MKGRRLSAGSYAVTTLSVRPDAKVVRSLMLLRDTLRNVNVSQEAVG
jgi:hypothetical protein